MWKSAVVRSRRWPKLTLAESRSTSLVVGVGQCALSVFFLCFVCACLWVSCVCVGSLRCVGAGFTVFSPVWGFPGPLLRQTASSGAPKISLHFLSPPQISFFLLSLDVFSLNCARGTRPWSTRRACSGFFVVFFGVFFRVLLGCSWPVLWSVVDEVDHSPNWPKSTLAEFARCAVLCSVALGVLRRSLSGRTRE